MSLLPYRPFPLLRSGHLQTLMVGLVCGWRPPHNAKEILIPLQDDDSLVVHEENCPALPDSAPLTILVHGLGGDHRSPYLQRLAHKLSLAGQRVWRIDLRGSGAGLEHAWRPPHAGRSDDLAAVVNAACRAYPRADVNLAGFSLSGNIVLKMLGEAFDGRISIPIQRIQLALAIAPPIDLALCADNMDRFSRKLYTKYYLRVLENQVEQRRRQWSQWESVPREPFVKTIRQFDARYTAPLSGFQNTAEYYSNASAKPLLEKIETQTLILIDRSDPIVTASAYNSVRTNPSTTKLVFTRHGGHMGYFGLDASGKLMRWMEHYARYHLVHGTNTAESVAR